MERRIFTGSNSLMRGQMLAPKAGFFCANHEGYFTPTYWRPAFTEPLFEEATPAQVDCLTAVFGGPLFCLPKNVKQSRHAHRNSHTYRTGHPLRQTRLGAPSPTLKPTAGIKTHGVHSGKYFALCTYSVHLPGMRQNEPFRLRPPFQGAFGLLLSGDKTGGQKSGNPLRAFRKSTGQLHVLIH